MIRLKLGAAVTFISMLSGWGNVAMGYPLEGGSLDRTKGQLGWWGQPVPLYATAPTLKITNLTNGQRISNEVYVVKGMAMGNLSPCAVWYRVNGGDWTQAAGSYPWSAPVTLAPGTNVFQAYAQSGAENRSAIMSVKCVRVVMSPLTLMTNGWGGISRIGFGGTQLEVGRNYAVGAVAGVGQMFTEWTGTTNSTGNPLKFAMQPGMVIQANFAPDPWLGSTGKYVGLFYPADFGRGLTGWIDANNSGAMELTLTNGGGFAGSLSMLGTNTSFAGKLGTDMGAQVTVPQARGAPLGVSVYLDPEYNIIVGAVERDGERTSRLELRRAARGRTNPAAGKYTLLMEGCGTGEGTCFPGGVPLGDGLGTATVSGEGEVRMSGWLSDGTSMKQNTMVTEDGDWALYMPLYKNQGLLIGWMSFDFSRYEGLALVAWRKPAGAVASGYYTNGFFSPRRAVLTRHQAPKPGANAVNWTNGTVAMIAGGFPSKVTSQVRLINNRVVWSDGSISNLSLSITASNGVFSGRFTHPGTGRLTPFNGVVVQREPEMGEPSSGGWFWGPTNSGTIRIEGR